MECREVGYETDGRQQVEHSSGLIVCTALKSPFRAHSRLDACTIVAKVAALCGKPLQRPLAVRRAFDLGPSRRLHSLPVQVHGGLGDLARGGISDLTPWSGPGRSSRQGQGSEGRPCRSTDAPRASLALARRRIVNAGAMACGSARAVGGTPFSTSRQHSFST